MAAPSPLVALGVVHAALVALRGIGRWNDVWFNGFATVRMTLFGEPGTTAYGADDPFSAPEIDWGRQRSEAQTSIAAFCARRVAKSTTFVALHEPYAKGPQLSVRRFERSSGAEGMVVMGAGFLDVVCTALDDADTLHSVGDPLQAVRFRNYAWIRTAHGKVQDAGLMRRQNDTLRAHARGYLMKQEASSVLKEAIATIMEGKTFISAKTTEAPSGSKSGAVRETT